jgi:hypothetical protein
VIASSKKTSEPLRLFAREWAAHEFGEYYRGYRFMGLQWGILGNEFRVFAFMPNSPLHPMDFMYQNTFDAPLQKEPLADVVTNAVLSLKKFIDTAYEDPKSFTTTSASTAID